MPQSGPEPHLPLVEEAGPSKQLVGDIAQSINCAVNACTSIGPMTLFATALTLTQRGAIDRVRLTVQLELLEPSCRRHNLLLSVLAVPPMHWLNHLNATLHQTGRRLRSTQHSGY